MLMIQNNLDAKVRRKAELPCGILQPLTLHLMLLVAMHSVHCGCCLLSTHPCRSQVAQFPHELVTYGGNGTVFSNWFVPGVESKSRAWSLSTAAVLMCFMPVVCPRRAQYRLVMKYLSEMTNEQTLVLYSGHPMGSVRRRGDCRGGAQSLGSDSSQTRPQTDPSTGVPCAAQVIPVPQGCPPCRRHKWNGHLELFLSCRVRDTYRL